MKSFGRDFFLVLSQNASVNNFVSGLDPAGPYFQNTPEEVRLDSSDADFVDVIHSDAEKLLDLGLGTAQVSGHVDFWPNNGIEQPGCDQV